MKYQYIIKFINMWCDAMRAWLWQCINYQQYHDNVSLILILTSDNKFNIWDPNHII